MSRDLDIVVFGATGDTGIVGCCYLFFKGKQLGITSWAPAARNLSKLQKDVLDRLQNADPATEVLAPAEAIHADSSDYSSLLKMCSRTKCVVACAGPFAQFGEDVIRACIEAGSNYVDITGEIDWVAKMQHKYGKDAEEKGVTIVNCAGYDSVPPDITTCLAAEALQKTGERLQRFEAFVGFSGGAMPTGTLNTVLAVVDEGKRRATNLATLGMFGKKKPRSERLIKEGPELITTGSEWLPETERHRVKSNLFWSLCPGYSPLAGQFCLGHFMAPVNVNIVHHTAAKLGYGGLVYRERQGGLPNRLLSLYGLVPTLLGISVALIAGLMLCLPFSTKAAPKLRDLFNTPLQKYVRNQAFAGYLRTGNTSVLGVGASETGQTIVNIKMSCNYDCGLGFTMLSACVVAAQLTKQDSKPGFNSAVVAIGGETLRDSLQAAGVNFEVEVKRHSRL